MRSCPRSAARPAVLATAAIALLAQIPRAQSARLNGPLVHPLGGDVTDYRISADGTRVLFRADQAEDDVFELFSAPIDGGAPAVRLHPALSGGRDVRAFEPTSSGRVVFLADLGTVGDVDLFSVPIDGSAGPTLLSTTPASGVVDSFRLAAGDSQVVFRAADQLYSAPVAGGTVPLALDPQGRRCSLYQVAPDGTFVVFATGPAFVFEEDLHRVPIDASQPPLLLAHVGQVSFTDFSFFGDVKIASDGLHASFTHVIEVLDRGGPCGLGQYSYVTGLTLDGSQVQRLSQARTDCAELLNICPCLVPHEAVGDRVVYPEPDGTLYSVRTDGTGRIALATSVRDFAISPDESAVILLSGAPSASTLVFASVDGSFASRILAGPGILENPRMGPGSTLVAYVETDVDTGFRGLYAVNATGGARLLLNAPAVPLRGVQDFTIAEAGGTIVYREDRASAGVYELWSIDPSLVPRRISDALSGFGDVVAQAIAPATQRVVYLADQNSDEAFELFSVPAAGGVPAVQLNEALPAGTIEGDVLSFRLLGSGARVLYRADEHIDEFIELYSTTTDGRGPRQRLTATLPDTGDVGPELAPTPAGDRVLFSFDASPVTLFSAPTAGGTAPVALDTTGGTFVFPPSFDPAGTRAVYRSAAAICNLFGSDFPCDFRLRSVRIDGSEPPVTLSDPSGSQQTVLGFATSPDGLQTVYVADEVALQVFDLYRVPTDGSGPSVQLNPPVVAGGDVFDARISPDGQIVVYRGDTVVNNRIELLALPITGGAPVSLTGTLPGTLDASVYRILSDSARVLFVAEGPSLTRTLHVVPIDGSAPPVELSGPLFGTPVIDELPLTGDEQFAFYRGVTGVFRTPLDGSAAPVQLSSVLPAGRQVTAFALSPDDGTVVYRADERADEVYELFRVPAAGGPVQPLVTLPDTADVTHFLVDRESQHVVFRANPDGHLELFRVPLAGGPVERISRPAPVTANVQSDFAVLEGGRVVYRFDGEADEVYQLYTFLDLATPPTRSAAAPTRARDAIR